MPGPRVAMVTERAVFPPRSTLLYLTFLSLFVHHVGLSMCLLPVDGLSDILCCGS